MQRRALPMILALAYVVCASACWSLCPHPSWFGIEPAPPAPPGRLAGVAIGGAATNVEHKAHDPEPCGETILDREALHAIVEARIAEHSAAFAACAPAARGRSVVTVHIALNVCGRGSLGTEAPDEVLDATKQCIDRVVSTIPFPSFGDVKFWHTHEFVFGEAEP